MINSIQRHLLPQSASVREALARLDKLASDAVVFLIKDRNILVGSITDGDIRRGLINGLTLETPLMEFVQAAPKAFRRSTFNLQQMQEWREKNFRILPVINDENRIVDIINFRKQRSFLPMDAVIMAGGVGSRLRPLTLDTPKPLLKVGDKPIIEHNIERLRSFGVVNLTISIKYLGQQLIDYFGDGSDRGMNITYVTEDEPRGTIGAVSEIQEIFNPYVLVMNSDLLTTIDLEEMFSEMLAKEADMTVATVPYEVEIPYGVIETEGDLIKALKEKPTYTYYSNAGIYIIRKEHIAKVPATGRYSAPDLMENLYTSDHRVTHFPILGYWLDIGKHNDFEKAQRDIEHLKL
ncbi:nucleotidyltransferase family protein [Lewinella sp. 4G2]|uniref:nucleotidyltransferase family protein n=1 Tax=Lewinella sp. 4G2 TaxID=1803372 RepID=UPI0007B49DF2|nr:nucleotidyltransferase family protein [Lewinella sp. 4G2]OAV44316.1 nucleotidyltransferase [Lewinella sp. 4G2]